MHLEEAMQRCGIYRIELTLVRSVLDVTFFFDHPDPRQPWNAREFHEDSETRRDLEAIEAHVKGNR